MDHMLKKLMALKKGKREMSDGEKEGKLSVLQSLKALAEDGMRKGLKKVTVASDSEEGLEAGLDKAKEIIEQKGHSKELPLEKAEESLEKDLDSDMEENEAEEHAEEAMEDAEESEMSDEEIDAAIAKLMAMKKAK